MNNVSFVSHDDNFRTIPPVKRLSSPNRGGPQGRLQTAESAVPTLESDVIRKEDFGSRLSSPVQGSTLNEDLERHPNVLGILIVKNLLNHF